MLRETDPTLPRYGTDCVQVQPATFEASPARSYVKMPDDRKVLLEVIACSVVDAIEAEKGGANRLEVVRDLQRGGLTPRWKLVKEIKQAVDLLLRVMLRESEGYETKDEDEINRLFEPWNV